MNKKSFFAPVGVITLILFITFSCQDRIYETFDLNNPVYMTYDELRSAVTDTFPTVLEHPGKIYIYGNYLFVNEVKEGIHVIDNTDPASPEIITFIKIPGNIDLAVYGSTLYADSYVDLVVLDISDLSDIREINRIEDVFSYSLPPYEDGVRIATVDPSEGIVVAWKTEKVTQEVSEPAHSFFPVRGWDVMYEMDSRAAFASAQGGGMGDGTTGQGGSMARFIIYDDILFTIDNNSLHFFNLSDPPEPASAGSFPVGWNIETVFIARDHLFIGAMSGMYIYSLENPYQPECVSTYWHVTSCDPVVVSGNIAYITLRTGNTCESDVNQLDVVDVSDLSAPEKIKSYPMHNPYGLGIENNILFICDGSAGLKVYDAADPLSISSHKLAQFDDINAFDVIPVRNLLIMIGEEGIYQYDYREVTDIKLLSKIAIFED